MENVFWLNRMGLLMLDVPAGTGIGKSASNALKDGSSTPTKFVKLFLTNVNLTIASEIVNHAIKDT
jgi:hypothetical protein